MISLSQLQSLANPVQAINTINQNSSKIQEEFEKVLYANGQKALTGDLDINGKRLLNVPAPRTGTDVVRLSDLQGTEWDAEALQLRLDLASTAGTSLIGTLGGRPLDEWLKDELNAKDFGAVGDGIADDTAALQAWINECFETGRPGFLPAASLYYKTTAPLTCFVSGPPNDERWKGLTLRGTGAFGNPFAVFNFNKSSCMIRGFHDGPVFYLDGYDDPGMTNSMYIWGIIFSGNTTAEPIVKINSWYGTGKLDQFCVFQRGTGSGFLSRYMITVQLQNGYVLGPNWPNPSLPKTGTGVSINVKNDGGGVRLERITSRGWHVGFDIGGNSSPARVFQAVLDNCETSTNTNGVFLGDDTGSCTIQNMFIEGSNIGGIDLDIGGTGHRIVNNFNFAGSGIGINLRPTSSRCLVSGNELGVGSAEGETIGIRVRGAGHVIFSNTIRQANPPGVLRSRGILVEGVAPSNHIFSNFMEPNAWAGTGSLAWADETTYPAIPGDTSGGILGFAQQNTKNGSKRFNSLQGVSINPIWEPEVLTQADVSNTPRLDTLHLSGAMVQIFKPTASVTVRAFAGKNMAGKLFYLVCKNNNMTFVNGGYLLTHTGSNYTPPADGAVLTILISPLGVGIIVSVATPDIDTTPLLEAELP